MLRVISRLFCAMLVLGIAGCADWPASTGNPAIPINNYYGSQTIGGVPVGGAPTGSAGANAVH